MNGYNFTERVRKVLAMARDEAHRLHHEYVGTEHILLALILEGEGTAVAVLDALEIDSGKIRQQIEDIIQTGQVSTRDLELPYTSRAKKVLELSMASARDLNHNYVGTEHILLGLLREEKGIAAQVLIHAGLRLAAAEAETLRILDAGLSETSVSRNFIVSKLPPKGKVASVKLEIHFEDGSTVQGDFTSTSAAISFLARQ